MSVQNEIDRITTNISDAYDAVETKGGTLPATLNSDNLASSILSITGGSGDGFYWSSMSQEPSVEYVNVGQAIGNKMFPAIRKGNNVYLWMQYPHIVSSRPYHYSFMSIDTHVSNRYIREIRLYPDRWEELSYDFAGGGGQEPGAYIKSANASNNTLTLVNKDDTTVAYTPNIPTNVSAFTNDAGYTTETYVDNHHDSTKQDTLTAGENITIVDNVISATGSGTSDIYWATKDVTTYAEIISAIESGKVVCSYINNHLYVCLSKTYGNFALPYFTYIDGKLGSSKISTINNALTICGYYVDSESNWNKVDKQIQHELVTFKGADDTIITKDLCTWVTL